MAEMYKIRIRVGEFEVEVESTDKDYVEAKLKEHMAKASKAPRPETQAGKGGVATNKPTSLQEFTNLISPAVDTEFVLAVTYFCEKNEGLTAVSSADVKRRFSDIKYHHTNPYYAISRAKKNGFIMEGPEKGTFVTTRSGERWVEERLSKTAQEA